MTTLRLAVSTDAAAIADIYGPFCESTPISFEVMAPTAQEIARRIDRITAQYPWLVLDDGGIVAGYAYASQHRERLAYQWSVDVAVYVRSEYRRLGVARALYAALLDLLRLQGYFKAYGGITLPNPASVALHESVGFKPIAVYRGVGYKLGTWHDVAWYGAELQPEQSAPDRPHPIGEFVESPSWREALTRGMQRDKGR